MPNHGPMETKPGEWYVIGIIMGASVTAIVAVLLMILGLHDATIANVKYWETLLTGAMALAGAIATVHWIQRQIDQAREQEADRIERALFAARATMPAALADIVKFAAQGLIALKRIPQASQYRTLIKLPEGWTAPPLPSVPSYAVEVIRACIETADTDTREQMADLLRHLQICNSRLRGVFEEEFVPGSRYALGVHEMHAHLADFVELHLRSDQMISYARGETASIENAATMDAMVRRSIFSGLEHYPGYLDEVRRRYRENP
jgi:hypothetical protein